MGAGQLGDVFLASSCAESPPHSHLSLPRFVLSYPGMLAGPPELVTDRVPFVAVMTSVPFLTVAIEKVLAPVFRALGSTGAMASNTIVAVDMGGNQLARSLAGSNVEEWFLGTLPGCKSVHFWRWWWRCFTRAR